MTSFAYYQSERRRLLWSLLGTLPAPRPVSAHLRDRTSHPGFTLEHLDLDLNGLEGVPAYLLLPEDRPQPAGALLYLHAHGGDYGLGKEELLTGRPGLAAYAPELARLGLVTLAIDTWCFGERQKVPDGQQGEHDAAKRMLWQGQVLWGMMLFDEWQALGYLLSRPEVDPARVGVLGMSMGATKAWWLAALDERVRLCIDLCCLTDFTALLETNYLKGHGIYYYVPGLLRHFHSHQINELIVPRPRLSLNGRYDPLTPVAGVERIRRHLAALHEERGCADDCRIEIHEGGHEETGQMRQLVLQWLGRLC